MMIKKNKDQYGSSSSTASSPQYYKPAPLGSAVPRLLPSTGLLQASPITASSSSSQATKAASSSSSTYQTTSTPAHVNHAIGGRTGGSGLLSILGYHTAEEREKQLAEVTNETVNELQKKIEELRIHKAKQRMIITKTNMMISELENQMDGLYLDDRMTPVQEMMFKSELEDHFATLRTCEAYLRLLTSQEDQANEFCILSQSQPAANPVSQITSKYFERAEALGTNKKTLEKAKQTQDKKREMLDQSKITNKPVLRTQAVGSMRTASTAEVSDVFERSKARAARKFRLDRHFSSGPSSPPSGGGGEGGGEDGGVLAPEMMIPSFLPSPPKEEIKLITLPPPPLQNETTEEEEERPLSPIV
jgi:hypothetical protein